MITVAPDKPFREIRWRPAVALRRNPDSGSPTPGGLVARSNDGRFYSMSSSNPGLVLVWNADGSFERTLGRAGGESNTLPTKGMNLFPGPEGRGLYVYGMSRWTAFSEDLDYIGSWRLKSVPGTRPYSAVLDDGRVLTSARGSGDRRHAFHIGDLSSGTVYSFGFELSDAERVDSLVRIAYGGGRSFWSARPAVDRDGYVVEEWSLNGDRLHELYRPASWMSLSARSPSTTSSGRPCVSGFHVDMFGRLLVVSTAPNESWRPLSPRPGGDVKASLYEVYLDVLDARDGRLLASTGPLQADEAIAELPFRYIARSSLGYMSPPSLAIPEIRIMTLEIGERR